MKIHHLRNATLIIEVNNHFILVDPMLGKKGSGLPFTLFRFKPRKNPLVDLPSNSEAILNKVTHCLITHLHPDHLDKDAEQFLKEKKIPVVCNKKDEKILQKKGLSVQQSLDYWKEESFLEGTIIGIPAIHGYGFIAKPMGNVMGFYINFSNEKSVYISADTIYTDHVERVLTELKPDVAVVACGSAQLDFGQPLLMRIDDIIRFIKTAPQNVLANHLEALNHCPTTRKQLKEKVIQYQLQSKIAIPDDGECIMY